MSDAVSVSGLLSEKDVKSLTKLSRGGTVGPTAVYYAGVTAPVISASISVMVRNTLENIGASPYWQWFIAALVAAFAGISWYLIFIRWSYRHSHGRGNETTQETFVTLGPDQFIIKRGGVETRADWASVSDVSASRNCITVQLEGASPVLIPNSWFGKDKVARKDFMARLNEKVNA